MRSQSSTSPASIVITQKFTSALITASLGLVFIFFVGFMQGKANIIHNAAHDTRHSISFPCH